MNIRIRAVYTAGILIIVFSIILLLFFPIKTEKKIDIIMEVKELLPYDNQLIGKDSDIIGIRLSSEETMKILIFYLNDKTGDEAFSWISDGFPSILYNFFIHSPTLEPVSIFSYGTALHYFDYEKAIEMDIDSSIMIGDQLDADFIVLGDYYLKGKNLHFDIKIYNVKNKELIGFLQKKIDNHEEIFQAMHRISNYSLGIFNIDLREKSKMEGLWTKNRKAFQMYQNALWYFYHRQYSKAVQDLKKAIELDEDFLMCYYYLAILYRRLESEADFIEIAYKRRAELTDFYQKLVEAEYLLNYHNNIIEAEKLLISLSDAYGSDKQVLHQLAELKYLSKDYDSALEYLEILRSLDPEDIMTSIIKAEIMIKKSDINNAILIISEHISRRPFAIGLYLKLADIFESAQSYSFALEQYRTALDIEGDSIEAKLKKARLLIFITEIENALLLLSNMDLDSQYHKIFYSRKEKLLLMCHLLREDWENAKKCLNKLEYYEDEMVLSLIESYILQKKNKREDSLNILLSIEEIAVKKDLDSLKLFVFLLSGIKADNTMHDYLLKVKDTYSESLNPEGSDFIDLLIEYYKDSLELDIETIYASYDHNYHNFIILLMHLSGTPIESDIVLEFLLTYYKDLRPYKLNLMNIIYLSEINNIAEDISLDPNEIYDI